MPPRQLTLRLTAPGALASQASHARHGGLFVPLPEPPPAAGDELVAHLVTPSGAEIDLGVRVVHLQPGVGMALTFTDEVTARAALEPLLVQASPGGGPAGEVEVAWADAAGPAPEERDLTDMAEITGAAGAGAEQEATAAAGDTGVATEPERQALVDRIRAMSQAEKMQLALHGGRLERHVLSRDTNKTIHAFVIKNPRITLEEVKAMAAFRQTNPEVLKMIAENAEWGQNPTIVTALVGNPRTPAPVVRRIFDRLPVTEVRRLARASDAPPVAQQLARKKAIGEA